MSLTGSTNEQKIWNYLKQAGMNNYGIAGLMGNLFAESGLKPKNLENRFENQSGYTDSTYTEAVDNGTYANFTGDKAGYGIAQWTYGSRKAALLAFALERSKSIGDLEMQLGFLMKELKESFSQVLYVLKNADSIRAASDKVMVSFENPADQSEKAMTKRAGYGQVYYDKFASAVTTATATEEATPVAVQTVTEAELRKKIVDIAVGWLGCRESDGSHRKIIDVYNSHKPIARGYAVQYSDAWCSTFASAVAIKAGFTDIIPTECGCERHIQLFKSLGSWKENDDYIPKVGDFIFYDWDDSGDGDCTGSADHIGIVVSVYGTAIKVIEGNISNSVGYRNIEANAKYIRGYGTPDYAGKAGTATEEDVSSEKVSAPATPTTTGTETVYTVRAGDCLSLIAQRFGVTCAALAAFNSIKNPNIVQVGQLIRIPGIVAAASSSQVKSYTVVRGDTLWKIAREYLGNGMRYPEIMELNGLKTTVIRAGQKLLIP